MLQEAGANVNEI